jgi:hypothetical protein
VEPPTGAQRHRDPASEIRSGPATEASPALVRELNDLHRQVVECLREAGKSLTVKQLEARISSPSETLQEALDLLVERRLLARLNTIIPSYSSRAPGVEVHTE